MTTSRSGIPRDVLRFMNALADELGQDRDWWAKRAKRGRINPQQRLIIMLVMLRWTGKFQRPAVDMHLALDLGRGTAMAIKNQMLTLLEFEPDIARACKTLEGYQAGRFILEQYRVPINLCMGKLLT